MLAVVVLASRPRTRRRRSATCFQPGSSQRHTASDWPAGIGGTIGRCNRTGADTTRFRGRRWQFGRAHLGARCMLRRVASNDRAGQATPVACRALARRTTCSACHFFLVLHHRQQNGVGLVDRKGSVHPLGEFLHRPPRGGAPGAADAAPIAADTLKLPLQFTRERHTVERWPSHGRGLSYRCPHRSLDKDRTAPRGSLVSYMRGHFLCRRCGGLTGTNRQRVHLCSSRLRHDGQSGDGDIWQGLCDFDGRMRFPNGLSIHSGGFGPPQGVGCNTQAYQNEDDATWLAHRAGLTPTAASKATVIGQTTLRSPKLPLDCLSNPNIYSGAELFNTHLAGSSLGHDRSSRHSPIIVRHTSMADAFARDESAAIICEAPHSDRSISP